MLFFYEQVLRRWVQTLSFAIMVHRSRLGCSASSHNLQSTSSLLFIYYFSIYSFLFKAYLLCMCMSVSVCFFFVSVRVVQTFLGYDLQGDFLIC
uniref:Secreted protein n=1 Tax=Ascaris lumbricoides TaxID=6252 RepID=A0A0M3HI01_ASCLU